MSESPSCLGHCSTVWVAPFPLSFALSGPGGCFHPLAPVKGAAVIWLCRSLLETQLPLSGVGTRKLSYHITQ